MSMDTLPPAINAQIPFLKSILLAVVLFICGWIGSKWTHRLVLRALSTRHLDQALVRFIGTILRYVVLAAAVLAAMDSVGIHTTSLVAILASAGLAVGLALQGSLSNFASGVMLLFFRPFHLGDKVKINTHVGIVDDIGLFTTILVSGDNEKMIIPNTIVTGGVIINSSERGTLRGTLSVPIHGGAGDVERVINVLLAAAKRTHGVAPEPPPAVVLTNMEADSLDFGVGVWYRAVDEEQVFHDLRRAVLEDLEAAKARLGTRPKLILSGAQATDQT